MMVNLWIMNPTITNRRHFFLLDNRAAEIDRIESLLFSAGFQRTGLTESNLTDGSAQILLHKSGSESESLYIGGAVFPNDKTIHNARAKARLASLSGKLFLLSFLIYVIMWIAAFAAVLTGLSILFQFLGPAIPLMYFAIAGFGACTSILYIYLDTQAAKQNQRVAEHAWDILIPLFQDHLKAQIQRLSIPTKLGDRRIRAHIPQEISSKVERLDFGDIDACFWDQI